MLLLFLLALTTSAVYAWLSNSLESTVGATSYVHKSYFESGDGTSTQQYNVSYDADGNPTHGYDSQGNPLTSEAGCAFEIRYPLQLYYFAWLQNLGYFNEPDPETGEIEPVYFYISEDLDMTGWVLPPSGTAEYPFIGEFNGNGHTISNLTVTNANTVTDIPNEGTTGDQIIGFFGVVGEYNGSANANNHTARVENFTLNTVTIESTAPAENKSLVGVAAGYVNGVMNGVAVANSTVTVGSGVSALGMPASESGGGTTNQSDYGLVGYCTEPYRLDLNVTRVTLAAPVETQNVMYKNLQDEGPGFGGSVKMDNLFTRLTDVRSNLTGNRTPTTAYPTAQTVVRDEHGVEVSRVTTATSSTFSITANQNQNIPPKAARYYSSDESGMYYYYNTNDNFLYMYQETMTVTNMSYTGEIKNGFKVSNGANYMTLSSANALASTADADAANGWVLENGRLYTYSNANGSTYYLNRGNNNTLSVGTTASTTNWTRNADDTLSYTYNNHTWYLTYNNGWSVYPGKETFRIRSNGYYLNRSGNTTVNGVANNPGNTAEWAYDETTGGISVFYNNNVYYLNSSAAGAVSLSTTRSTSWTKTENSLYFTDNAGVKWYLRYANGAWSCFPSETAYRVTDGSYYFGVNGTAFAAVNAANAADWVWDADNGHLYTVVNGTIRYLNATNTLSLGTTASTVWTRDGAAHMSYTYNNGTWYLYREGAEWKVYPYADASVISQDGNYLNIASTTAVGSGTDADAATRWVFDNGAISTYYNGNTYYLNASGANVSVSTTRSTTWTRNSDGTLSYTYNNAPWYLVFSDGWKAYPSLDLVAVHSGDDYLAPNGTNAVTNSADAPAYWLADGNKLYTVVGTTNYYLRAQTTGLSLSTAANGTNFTYNAANKTLTFTANNTTYYVVFNGTNWTVSTSAVSGGPISARSGNTTYYLNASTTAVSTGNSANNATDWVYNEATGKIYMTSGNTTYYLRGLLANVQTRSTTNLAVTTNENDSGTAWEYSGNNLTCALQVDNAEVTYTLTLENNTFKLMDTSKNYYTIESSGGYYLNVSDAANPALNASNSDDNAVLWSFSNDTTPGRNASTSTTVSTVARGVTRYLVVGNGSASISNNSTQSQYYNYYNYYYYIRNSGGNYYLRYNNGWTSRNSRNNNDRITRTEITFTPATVTVSGHAYETEEDASAVSAETVFTAQGPSTLTYTPQDTHTELTYTDVRSADLTLTAADVHALRNDGTTTEGSTYASAFPINVIQSSPYAANPDTNTGYIVAGGISPASSSGRGDIRVSQYSADNISTATNGTNGWTQSGNWGNTYYTYNATADSRLEVITGVDNGTYSGWYRVSDSFNANNNSVNANISSAASQKINFSTLGFKRYEDARQSMSDTFVGSRYIYGLHFMDAAIDVNKYVTLPKAYIESEEYTNFQVPNDSIDFHVKRRGFITVFAGSYYGGNTSFFSLHRIFRYAADDPEVVAGYKNANDLKEIKEISQIYKPREGDDFIYKYADGTYSDGKSASDCGSIAFDMVRMTNPGSAMVQNAVYYFEIPVNGGEFALGSVPGSDGAYLFYLDIAANGGMAEDKDRVTITERFTEEDYDVTLPKGVQLTAGGGYDAQRPYETATIALAGAYNGSYDFVRNGNAVVYNSETNTELTYIGGRITVSNSNGDPIEYFPHGYVVRSVENITDTGRDTHNVDKLRVETLDTFDKNGVRTGNRTVTVYGGVSLTDVEADFVEIVTFTYAYAGHENMKTRIIRAASEGGFNIVFDEVITLLSISVPDDRVHVNFGDNTSVYMQTFTAEDTPVENVTLSQYAVVDMTNGFRENIFYPSVYGPNIAYYFTYVEGGNITRTTEPVLTTSVSGGTSAKIPAGSTSATQTLNYTVTLTSTEDIYAYGTQLINTYSGTTRVINTGGTTANEATFTVNTDANPAAVIINGVTLEKDVPKEIVTNASP